MRISVNLATRPFVELRPFFLRLRIMMAALAVTALALGIVSHLMTRKLRRAQDQMAEVHAAVVQTQQEKNRAERSMHQPANAAVLERAHFLNALFLRKSFSWTAVMMDLENVLPTGVQVTSIEPSVTPGGDVLIRLRVAGDRDRAVQLVRNLERSQRFLHPRLSGEASQAKDNKANAAGALPGAAPAGVEFDILADYNPLPANESFHYPKARVELMGAEAATPRAVVPVQTVLRPQPLPAARPSQYPRDGVVLRPYQAAPVVNDPQENPIQRRPPAAVGPRLPQGGGTR